MDPSMRKGDLEDAKRNFGWGIVMVVLLVGLVLVYTVFAFNVDELAPRNTEADAASSSASTATGTGRVGTRESPRRPTTRSTPERAGSPAK
jgi:hypothetical protein